MFKTKTKRQDNEPSRTQSTKALIRKNGEVFGVTHRPSSSSYDAPDRIATSTTYKSTYVVPPTIAPDVKKPLTPYSTSNIRNIPPVRFPNTPKSYVRLCAPRNTHQFEIKYGRSSDVDRTRFNTTYRNNFVHHETTPVGFNNTGIASEQTQWIKKRLND